MKQSELKELIRECIREELSSNKTISPVVKKYVRMYTPVVVKEVVEDMVEESITETLNALLAQKQQASKSKNLTESFEPYPTMGHFDTSAATRFAAPAMNRQLKNTISTVHMGGEKAEVLVPVDQRTVPDHIKIALNTDYRDLMGRMSGRSTGAPPIAPINIDAERFLGRDR